MQVGWSHLCGCGSCSPSGGSALHPKVLYDKQQLLDLLVSGSSSGDGATASSCVNRTTSWVSNIRWYVLGEASAFVLAPPSEQLFPASLCDRAADQPWTTHQPANRNAGEYDAKWRLFQNWLVCDVPRDLQKCGLVLVLLWKLTFSKDLCCFVPLCEQGN